MTRRFRRTRIVGCGDAQGVMVGGVTGRGVWLAVGVMLGVGVTVGVNVGVYVAVGGGVGCCGAVWTCHRCNITR